jgi:ribosome-binding factor A
VGEGIRQEISQLLLSEVHDPGIGLITLTRVKVSPDLQLARIFYTQIGDDKAKSQTRKALERATPFLRRQLASRINLRRAPEIRFEFDESIENQDRIERILMELAEERKAREEEGQQPQAEGSAEHSAEDSGDEPSGPSTRRLQK